MVRATFIATYCMVILFNIDLPNKMQISRLHKHYIARLGLVTKTSPAKANQNNPTNVHSFQSEYMPVKVPIVI